MSGHGAPTLKVDGRGLRVAVVAASWHTQVMDGLVADAGVVTVAAHLRDLQMREAPTCPGSN